MIESKNNNPEDELISSIGDHQKILYESLIQNESAVSKIGNQRLLLLASELAENIEKNAPSDWVHREHLRAKFRVRIKRTLRRYNFPPDQQNSTMVGIIELAVELGQKVDRIKR